MPTYRIPLGATLAAERAYVALSEVDRSNPEIVVETILQAASPYVGPIVAQLGRRRISETDSREILRCHLRGESTAALADRYAVTTKTINAHVRRRLGSARVLVDAGMAPRDLARRIGCETAALVTALDGVRYGNPSDSSSGEDGVSLRSNDHHGSLGGRRQRSDSGRRRTGRLGIARHRGQSEGIFRPAGDW